MSSVMAVKQIRCCSHSRRPLRISSEAECRALPLSALSSSKRSRPRRLCLCALRCCFKLLNTSNLPRCNGGEGGEQIFEVQVLCSENSGYASVVRRLSILAHPPDPHKFKMGWGGGGDEERWSAGGGGGSGGVMKEGERGSPHRLQRVPALKMKPTEALNGVLRHRRDPFRRFLSDAPPKEGLAKTQRRESRGALQQN